MIDNMLNNSIRLHMEMSRVYEIRGCKLLLNFPTHISINVTINHISMYSVSHICVTICPCASHLVMCRYCVKGSTTGPFRCVLVSSSPSGANCCRRRSVTSCGQECERLLIWRCASQQRLRQTARVPHFAQGFLSPMPKSLNTYIIVTGNIY